MVRTSPVISVAAYRYAKALYSVAQEKSCVPALQSLLNEFVEKVFLHSELQSILYNPKFSVTKKQGFFDSLLGLIEFSSQEKACVPVFSRFMSLLISYSRLSALPAIVNYFNLLVRQSNNEEIALVKTSIELSRAQEESLKAELEQATGKSITLDKEVDPNLLGGMVVQIGSLQIDTSLRTKLNSLKYALKEVD